MSTTSSSSMRLTCVALGLDLRALFQFGRRLVAAGQRPILANRVELAADFAQRYGLNIIVIQVPHGNVALAVKEIVRQLQEKLPDVRLVLEVPDDNAVESNSLAGPIQYVSAKDEPARIRAVIDVVTFAEGLVGAVAKLDLVDYLQLLIMNRHSRALQIRGQYSGDVVVRSGEIVHATCGQLRGEAALFKLLGQRAGSFFETNMPSTFDCSISSRADMLLLEAMRQRDEHAHSVSKREQPTPFDTLLDKDEP